jgi:hypothetical protein
VGWNYLRGRHVEVFLVDGELLGVDPPVDQLCLAVRIRSPRHAHHIHHVSVLLLLSGTFLALRVAVGFTVTATVMSIVFLLAVALSPLTVERYEEEEKL